MKKVILILSVFSFVFGAHGSPRRKQCRRDFRTCITEVKNTNIRRVSKEFRARAKRCRQVRYSCNHDEQGLSCKDIYHRRAAKMKKHRDRAQTVGALTVVSGLSVAGITASVALISLSATPLVGSAIMLGVATTGLATFAVANKGSQAEWVLYFAGGDIPQNTNRDKLNVQELKQGQKILKKGHLETSYFESFPSIREYFAEGVESGKFCENYPHLYNVSNAAKQMKRDIANGDFQVDSVGQYSSYNRAEKILMGEEIVTSNGLDEYVDMDTEEVVSAGAEVEVELPSVLDI